ncbi:MAG TPA: KR domain-containing protein, partial [Acidimicrobiales bacterium]|nr:KR domain-containing protein [Acidimicrobiales bacterium]
GREVALASLGALYIAGYPLDHARRGSRSRPFVPLPTYAWHRARYWLAGVRAGKANSGPEGPALDGYAILGRKFASLRASGERYFEVDIGLEDHPELFRHRIEGVPLFPVGAAIEMALVSGRQEIHGGSFTVRDFNSPHDVVLEEDQLVTLQMVMSPDGDRAYSAELFAARPHHEPALVATASLVRDGAASEWSSGNEPPREIKARLDEMPATEQPRSTAGGSAFLLERMWAGPGEALAMLRLPEEVPGSSGTYLAHPGLLTRSLELLGVAAGRRADLVLSGFRSLRVKRSFGDTIWAYAHALSSGTKGASGEIRIWDRSEALVAEFDGAELRPCDPEALRSGLRHKLDDLLYDLEWQVARSSSDVFSTVTGGHDESAGTWLVFAGSGSLGDNGGFGDDDSLGDEVAEALVDRGHRVIVVQSANALAGAMRASRFDGDRRVVDATVPGDTTALVSELVGPGLLPLQGVVFVGAEAAGATESWLDQIDRSCAGLLHLAQALVEHKAATSARLWVVTRGTQPVRPDTQVSAALAPLWGLGRVIALEHPEVWGGLIDLEQVRQPDDVTHVLAELHASDGEDQVAYRLGARYVLRLARRRADVDADPEAELNFRPDASYVITGGRGALGLKVANWMASRGARHLVLTGRQPVPRRADWGTIDKASKKGALVAAIESLEAQGVVVHTPTADVTKLAEMAPIFRSPPSSWPPVRGVVHAAGVFRPDALVDMTFEELCAVLAPKVRGSW